VVPNPWIGYEFVGRVFGKLLATHKGGEKVVANNLVWVWLLFGNEKSPEKSGDFARCR
jgi:hypothetical protein